MTDREKLDVIQKILVETFDEAGKLEQKLNCPVSFYRVFNDMMKQINEATDDDTLGFPPFCIEN